MKIVVIGTGYVGLVSGVCFAEIGHNVTCIDIDQDKVDLINNGISPIHENRLQDLLERNVNRKNLEASLDLNAAIKDADISLITVSTPFDDNSIDLSYVSKVSGDIGKALKELNHYHVVCVKSTVEPGTTEKLVGPLITKYSGKKLGKDWGLSMNPEFLAEGSAVKDFMNPDRIVIGANDNKASKMMQKLYSIFNDSEVVITNIMTAEMIKYASNTFLATVISFANEIANLCEVAGDIDAVDVVKGVHADRRLSPIFPKGRIVPDLMSFLYPGTGFGGSCFPKDLKSLIAYGKKIEQPMHILEAVLEINNNQPLRTIDKARKAIGNLSGKKIAVLGLSFKPGTDDIRESPAIPIIKTLINDGAMVLAHDPIAIKNMKVILSDKSLTYVSDLKSAINNIDAIILVTSWPEYQNLSMYLKSNKIPIVDGRRFLDKNKYDKYSGIGLGNKLTISEVNV